MRSVYAAAAVQLAHLFRSLDKRIVLENGKILCKKKNNNLKPLFKFQNSFALRGLQGRTIHKDRSSRSLSCVTCRRQNTKDVDH